MMTIKEVREKNPEQLRSELAERQKHLFDLRSQAVTEKLEDPSQLRKTRKEIARILTVMRQRELEGGQSAGQTEGQAASGDAAGTPAPARTRARTRATKSARATKRPTAAKRPAGAKRAAGTKRTPRAEKKKPGKTPASRPAARKTTKKTKAKKASA